MHRLHCTVQEVALLLLCAPPISLGIGQRYQQLMLAFFCHSQISFEQCHPRGSTLPQLKQHGAEILELAHTIWLDETWMKECVPF